MNLQAVVLILALLTNYDGLDSYFMSLTKSELPQDSKGSGEPKIKCIISSNDPKWSSKRLGPVVSVHIQFQGSEEISALASLQLTALPKGHGLSQVQYWAPFDIISGGTSKGSQTIRAAAGQTYSGSVRLTPMQLLWAPSKSSTWPSQEFAKAVPPGHYSLQVQLELAGGAIVTSNETSVTVVK